MQSKTELLKSRGLKATPQRIAIYGILAGGCGHPSAETIYKAIEEQHPTMSLATVYKTLDAFKERGLVQELNVCEDCFRYDARTEPHPHVVCNKCGKIADAPSIGGLSEIRGAVEDSTGFSITGEQIYYYGICPDCEQDSE